MNPKIKSLCALDKPYPEVRVERENRSFAKMLSLAYAGISGELPAIMQYEYSASVCAAREPYALSEVLSCISVCEMRHLKILAELILLLGELPVYIPANRRAMMNPASLFYGTDCAAIVKNALESERRAIKLYTELIKFTADNYIKAILSRIIEDEEHHIKILSEFM